MGGGEGDGLSFAPGQPERGWKEVAHEEGAGDGDGSDVSSLSCYHSLPEEEEETGERGDEREMGVVDEAPGVVVRRSMVLASRRGRISLTTNIVDCCIPTQSSTSSSSPSSPDAARWRNSPRKSLPKGDEGSAEGRRGRKKPRFAGDPAVGPTKFGSPAAGERETEGPAVDLEASGALD